MPTNTLAPATVTRVSIVEDDAGIRENLLHFLKQAPDLQCVSDYGNAEDALRELPAVKPDVVLMDINLPRMNGIDCARALKDRLPEVQVLMVTVFEDSDLIFKALLAGANGYLLKDTIATEIVNAVRDVRRGGSPLNSLIARKILQFFTEKPPAQNTETSLTPREHEVIHLLAKGLAYKEIAARLDISIETVRRHCSNIYVKMHVSSRTEAVVKYLGK